MEEVNKKNKNNVALIIIIIVLILAIIGLCGYIFLNSSKYIAKSEKKETKDESTYIDREEDTAAKATSTIIFDGSKSINSTNQSYTLSCQGNAGIFISVDSTQRILTFSFTPTKVIEFYPLTWTSTREDMVNSQINFDQKIVDVFFGGMGQSSSGDTLFILLEDGTVEYIPIVHMFNHVQAEVVSYGKINGISDVAKFVLSNTPSGVTTLAIKNDGTFYDLWYALKDTGNY